MVHLQFKSGIQADADGPWQEVNPSLLDEDSSRQTVAIGCSLLRSALGEYHPVIHNFV